MKKLILLALAVILVFGLLAGCSANGYIDTPDERGNVSTTRDGRVNGTNQRPAETSRTQRSANGRTGDKVGVEGHIGIGRMS